MAKNSNLDGQIDLFSLLGDHAAFEEACIKLGLSKKSDSSDDALIKSRDGGRFSPVPAVDDDFDR